MNRLEGPKKVTLVASGDGWVEQSPLGVCPLLHFIQVQLSINSESVLLFRMCLININRMICICYELYI